MLKILKISEQEIDQALRKLEAMQEEGLPHLGAVKRPVAPFREVAFAVERWAVNGRRAINSKNSGIGAY